MMQKKIHIHFAIMFTLMCTISNMHAQQETLLDKTDKQPWLTIFIHGTVLVKFSFIFGYLAPLMHDNIAKTLYAQTVRQARSNTIFFQNQAIQGYGLKEIVPYAPQPGYASGALATIFDHIEQLVNPNKISYKNRYFTFGWSGLISAKERTAYAHMLYYELEAELSRLHAAGIYPRIRIVGYSHGGNVALDLALIKNTHTIHIDELILLGTPILSDALWLAESPLFGKIYNVFSQADRIQCLDCFTGNHRFSRRTFSTAPDQPISNKIVQIELQVYMGPRPLQCTTMGPWHHRRKKSPGHAELWFFGWTPRYYRKDFPLYPIPVAAFLPLIIHYAQLRTHGQKPVVTILDPQHHRICIKNADGHTTQAPFLSQQQMDVLTSISYLYLPCGYYTNHCSQQEKAYCTALKKHHAKKGAAYAARTLFLNVSS